MDGATVGGRHDGAALDGVVWEGLEEMRAGLRTFLARQCSDENDIEDVIQETFLRAARYRRGHRVQSLRPWAMRIALNVLADSKRRGVRTHAQPAQPQVPAPPQMDEPFDPPARTAATPADSSYRVGSFWLDGDAARELVLRTLGHLREQDRRLLDSFYGGERRTSASAQECGIPQRLVKVRLYRARQRLLHALRHRVALEACWQRLAS